MAAATLHLEFGGDKNPLDAALDLAIEEEIREIEGRLAASADPEERDRLRDGLAILRDITGQRTQVATDGRASAATLH